MESEDLTYIEVTDEEHEENDSVIIINSSYSDLFTQLNNYLSIFNEITNIWIGLDEGLKYVNKTIENPQKNLKILMNFNQVPFSFIRNSSTFNV